MTTLVTGGTGFVGIHVMRQLALEGQAVVSVSTRGDLDDVARDLLSDTAGKIICQRADILDLERLKGLLRDFDVRTVVHGAAITAIGELEREVPYQAIMVNVGGTASILEASRLQKVSRFIYLSSATVYGGGDPGIPLREGLAPNPTGIYAITKRAAEQVVGRYMELFQMEATVLRISAPYGPLERPTGRRELMSPIYGWCRAAMEGQEITLAEDLERDFTYAVDTARGVALACQASKLQYPLYNISSGRNFRFSEVLNLLQRLRPNLRVQYQATDKMDSFFRNSLRGPLDITRARADLGFNPEYDLERGLRGYLEWLEQHPV